MPEQITDYGRAICDLFDSYFVQVRGAGWYCTDECDHEASVYMCEQIDGEVSA